MGFQSANASDQEWRDGAPLCMCGCGEEAGFYKSRRAGDPRRFATGHSFTSPKVVFEHHVPVGAPDDCWEWTGRRSFDGYGKLGPYLLTHRVAYEKARGPIPEGMCVLHRCDNPPCCNPAHLFLGTQTENMADRDAKGRAARGGRKLNLEVAREIRARYAAGDVTHPQLAEEYGLHYASVIRVVKQHSWPEKEAA